MSEAAPQDSRPFLITSSPGTALAPVIAHLPHGGTRIPPEVRARIALNDDALQREVVRMTDWHTSSLFACVPRLGGVAFENRLSRLVVDPERFPDDAQEVMSNVGMGAVYTRTSGGQELRRDFGPSEREELLTNYFWPYSEAFVQLVSGLLSRFGRCLIIDGHSFPARPLPYELIQDPDRPAICVGTDEEHTPARVIAAVESCCARLELPIQRDRPFAGTYVPLPFYKRDKRVASVMLEVRRDLYSDEETGQRAPGFEAVCGQLQSIVEAAVAAWGEAP